eukprot:12931474-Prorocentrum_lima.AAC.1
MSRPETHLRFLRPHECVALQWLPKDSGSVVLPVALTSAAEFFAVVLSDVSPLSALLHTVQGDRAI